LRSEINRFGLIAADTLALIISPFAALFLRLDEVAGSAYLERIIVNIPILLAVQLSVFVIFKLYHRVWKYAGTHELFAIVGAVTVGQAVLFLLAQANGVVLPRSLYLLCGILNIAMVGGIRLAVRIASNKCQKFLGKPDKVLVFGAGDVGSWIVKEIRAHYGGNKKIVGFIDDDPSKQGCIINGVGVLGGRNDIAKIVTQLGVNEIVVAIPSARSLLVRDVVTMCRETQCKVQIVPALHEMIDGMVTLRQLRDVNLEDLLRREPVKLDVALMRRQLREKRVLITGAGGSIGSEICRQVAKLSPGKLYLLGKSENNIFEIERELLGNYPHLEIEPIIADVRDEKRIRAIFAERRPEIVFHAAAHKHVPLMESQPVEAVQNNIFGTMVVAKAAISVETECFVMVSTDKAINPSSVMGVTKRVAEMVICSLNGKSSTKFTAVRFGNVLGSRGSVVQLFRKQIARGESLTITHPEMCRYFMTIPEASQLVLQASAMALGGEVFVLDMGEPIKITDLACNLIELTGLTPYKDINIEYTGLRPGEKLFEEILSAEEGSTATKHEKIYMANLKNVDEDKLNEGLIALKNLDDSDKIINALAKLVPTYQGTRVRRLRLIDGKDSTVIGEGRMIPEEAH